MIFNEVDIYACKFFTLNEDRKLKFIGGIHKGKCVDDFKTINDLHHVTSYCFWILKNKEIPLVSKYCAAEFLREIAEAKLIALEKVIRRQTIQYQDAMRKKNEESANETGTKYV